MNKMKNRKNSKREFGIIYKLNNTSKNQFREERIIFAGEVDRFKKNKQ